METILSILFIAFILFFSVQFCYYGFVFSRFTFAKPQAGTPKKIPVSVIIWAKNECENLKALLPILLSQNYPHFELVVIDDDSSDDSLDLLEAYEKQYAFIKLVKVKNNEAFWGNKKYALTLGIKAAKYEYLLFTDASCRPENENWIDDMTAHFTVKKTIVLGYSSYNKIKGSFLNKLIRFDNVLAAIQYFSWAKINKPYKGIGKNLAYKKSEFFNVRGFMDHMKIRTGDDDLFINQASTAENTTINTTSFTYSDSRTSYSSWLQLKKDQITSAKYYKGFDQFQLATHFISQFFFICLAIVLLAFQYNWILVTILLSFRYIFNWIVIGYGASKLKEKDIIFGYPLFEFIVLFTHIRIAIASLFSKKTNWN